MIAYLLAALLNTFVLVPSPPSITSSFALYGQATVNGYQQITTDPPTIDYSDKNYDQAVIAFRSPVTGICGAGEIVHAGDKTGAIRLGATEVRKDATVMMTLPLPPTEYLDENDLTADGYTIYVVCHASKSGEPIFSNFYQFKPHDTKAS